MPKARGRRRGTHREKRREILKVKPHWLAREAPEGEYLVDAVAVELFLGEGVSLATQFAARDEFVKIVREDVSLAAQFAAMRARIHLVRRPEVQRLAKRYFSDLREIAARIKRNEGLNPTDLLVSTTPNPNSPRHEGPKRLQTVLRLTLNEIRHYLGRYRVRNESGNYDWFTRCFIDEVFELWCRYVRVDLNDEARVFNKLLAAAWRDVQFPTEEEDGRRLEDWLADRVRKHFSDGVCSARRDHQELALYLDNEREGIPG